MARSEMPHEAEELDQLFEEAWERMRAPPDGRYWLVRRHWTNGIGAHEVMHELVRQDADSLSDVIPELVFGGSVLWVSGTGERYVEKSDD